MLEKLLKIQKTEQIDVQSVRRITVVSKNDDGEDFICSHGSEFLGKYYNVTSEQGQRLVNALILTDQLNHPNILKPLGYFNNNDRIVIVYEDDLRSLDAFYTDDIDELIEILMQMIDVICYLHSNRIVHGNIKASSFYIKKGIVRLGNFDKSVFICKNNKTEVNFDVNDDEFRPLECFKSNECGFTSDIWALACTFCQLMYKRNLFPTQKNKESYIACLESWRDNISNTLGDNIEIPLTWANPDFFDLNKLILRMLNTNELKRPNIFEVKNMLSQTETYDLSSSPQSISSIINIHIPVYKRCTYNERSIMGNSRLEIKTRLSDKPIEYIYLVMAVYENVSTVAEFNESYFNVSCFVASCFTGVSSTISDEDFSILAKHIKKKRGSLFSLSSYFVEY